MSDIEIQPDIAPTQPIKPFNSSITMHLWSVRLMFLARSVIFGLLLASLWLLVSSGNPEESLILGFVAAILTFAVSPRLSAQKLSQSDLAMLLEINYPNEWPSALSLTPKEIVGHETWNARVSAELQNLRISLAKERRRIISSIIPIAIALGVVSTVSPPPLNAALSSVKRMMAALQQGVHLKVIEGHTSASQDGLLKLSTSSPAVIELLEKNMVELTITTTLSDGAPTVELRTPADQTESKKAELYQIFQMQRDGDVVESSDNTTVAQFKVSFSVPETVEIVIPKISNSSPLARINVKQAPVPKVTLTTTDELPAPDSDEYWADDKPVNFNIRVVSQTPLQLINFVVVVDGKAARETINRIVSPDKTEVTVSHSVVLETFLENDIAEVEMFAEAVDTTIPAPLIGKSKSIRVQTASAYGRYRRSLQLLQEVKRELDTQINANSGKVSKNASEAMSKALKQSENSPFFDALDRMQLQKFAITLEDLQEKPEVQGAARLNNQIADFLFEHETIDDRERDRDYFVAMRSLSRVIEQDKARRPTDISTIIERMKKFLDDRQKRWEARVGRLPAGLKPPTWPKIQTTKPFHKALTDTENFDRLAKGPSDPKALATISQSVIDYRSWIEELEAKEDEARKQAEQERQQGMASAKNELRELQKKQSEIASKLDVSGNVSVDRAKENWPSTRMLQNSNISGTKSLEAKMRAMAPDSSERLKVAIEAMEEVAKNGNSGNMDKAESYADLAGRLLRQAESAAQDSQNRRRERGRRRRVTGDNYYGQSVVGGDVEIRREYEVDKRYREAILDSVRGTDVSPEDKRLLEDYLRQIIR